MRHVIIGVGAAGIEAAGTIRKLRPEDDIIMISKDDAVHSRCMLHLYISGKRDEASLDFTPENFFEVNRIQWYGDTEVKSVDTCKKTVETTKESIGYDTLLIATGAVSVIPPVGALRTAPNVFGLRDLSDARAIVEAAEESSTVAIIGSGLVGLDAAYAMLEKGKKVTVIEMASYILPLQLDVVSAKTYQELFENSGAQFRLGISAKDTQCDDSGNVTHIVLETGEKIPCDMVIVAAGVRPAAAMLEGSGIEVDRSIKVGPDMKTSVDNVFAAGDVTGLSGIWPNAVKQGEVAGKNMCGERAEYYDTYAIKNTINFFGLQTLSVGKVIPEEGDETELFGGCGNYRKVILSGGKVKGVIIQGDISCSGFWQYLIKYGIDISGLDKSIWDISYADFFGMDSKGEFIWSVA